MAILAQLVKPQWLQLSVEVRNKLIDIFKIPRSEATMTSGGTNTVVLSDGHSHKDLESITIEKMQKYLDSQLTDFYQLFDKVLEKLNEDDKFSVEEESKKVADEKIARWLLIMRDIKQQSSELGLNDQLFILLGDMFDMEPKIKKGKKTK